MKNNNQQVENIPQNVTGTETTANEFNVETIEQRFELYSAYDNDPAKAW